MQCNIDAKGKAFRLVLGMALAATGAGLWVLVGLGLLHGTFMMGMATGVVLGGAFAIFESRAGWCVLRAMGFRTRI